MADNDKEPKPDSTKSGSRHWWQDLLLSVPKGLFWLFGVGLTGAAVIAMYGDDNGRKMIEAVLRTGKVIWKITDQIFERLAFIIFVLTNCILLVDSFLLVEFGRQTLTLGFASWPNTLINRVIGGMPVILLLQALLFFPIVRLAKWLIGAAIAEGLINKDGLDENIVTRYVRTIAKINAWHAVGFALAALPPYHAWPELLAIAACITPIWPYFCNAWKAGDSEHLRRIFLSVMGWATIDMVLMASIHMLVKAPFLSFYHNPPHFSWIALGLTTLFLLQLGGAWSSGARRTKADLAWERRKEERAHLENLAQRVEMAKKHGIDPSMLSQLGSVVPPEPKNRFGGNSSNQVANTSYPQPQSNNPLVTVVGYVVIIIIVLLAFGNAAGIFTRHIIVK